MIPTADRSAPDTGADVSPLDPVMRRGLLDRAADRGYKWWLSHVMPAAACSHPVRLKLETTWSDTHGTDIERPTDDMPDGRMYVACKNRRATVCPACAETYRADTYQLIKAGLTGGKGMPESVTSHPCVFVTLTAPEFGPVHTRVVTSNGRVRPCRMRRGATTCRHGRLLTCSERHAEDDPRLGEAICRDCYNYDHQAVWNLHTGELWRRLTVALNRHAARAGTDHGQHLRISYAKVAEFQRRGAVHFHALIRLDAYDPDPDHRDQVLTPNPGVSTDHLANWVQQAATATALTTDAHPHNPQGWLIGWGPQIDIRPIRLAGGDVDDRGRLTSTAVAGYLAKYATKATEEAGHASRRLTQEAVTYYTETDTHTARQISACWKLGYRPLTCTTGQQRADWDATWGKLHRWAHMLGFGGHFSTKSRRYSTTLTALRTVRRAYQRGLDPTDLAPGTQPDRLDTTDDDLTITLNWIFDGIGWLTLADASLANTAAAQARQRKQAAKEEMTAQAA